MPEPTDTIRRVNSDEPMTLEELYQARATLDRYTRLGKTDVKEARRRVGAMISEVEPAPSRLGHEGSLNGGPSLTEGRPPIANPVAGRKPGASTGSKIAAGVIMVAVVVGVVSCLRSLGDGGGDGRNDGMAKVMCENFIKDQLKAPATADFSSIFSTTITGSGNDYTVAGTVDAENSFGAKLHSNYTCEVHDNGGDRWSLVSLTGIN